MFVSVSTATGQAWELKPSFTFSDGRSDGSWTEWDTRYSATRDTPLPLVSCVPTVVMIVFWNYLSWNKTAQPNKSLLCFSVLCLIYHLSGETLTKGLRKSFFEIKHGKLKKSHKSVDNYGELTVNLVIFNDQKWIYQHHDYVNCQGQT